MPWLQRRFGIRGAVFGAFVVSGLLHELAISFPAGAGYGGPMAYFLIQGVGVILERKVRIRSRFVTAGIILLPLPLLFHSAFRQAFIAPFIAEIHTIMARISLPQAISIGILLSAVAHFAVLGASFQVPSRLGWRDELPRLSPFNQRLMWTYGSFIVFTIVSMGVLALVLRDEIVVGTRAGQCVSGFIAAFWGFRLLVDRFYFRSDEWPNLPGMRIGHILLNCLFTFIFIGFGSVFVMHLSRYL